MKKTEINIVPSIQPRTSSTRTDNSQIPVYVTSRSLEVPEGTSSKQEKSSENTVHFYGTSVAARKAQFQKYDSPVQTRSYNKNKSTFNKEVKKPEVVKQKVLTGTPTRKQNIPNIHLRKVITKSPSLQTTIPEMKTYENLCMKNCELEKENMTLREYLGEWQNTIDRYRTAYIEDMKSQTEQLQSERSELKEKLRLEELKMKKLETVSKEMCKEYEQLKRLYDVEMGAMHQAMQKASEWYKQNCKLKRMSQLMMQHLQNNPMEAPYMISLDEVDSNSEDLDQLRQTVTELSSEIARLQTELHSARLLEFEAQEKVTQLTTELENERCLRRETVQENRELIIDKMWTDNELKRIMEEHEHEQKLKVQCDHVRKKLQSYKTDAERVEDLKKEVEKGNDLMSQLLKMQKNLEEADTMHEMTKVNMTLLQMNLEMQVKRANDAEECVEELKELVHCLRQEIKELKEKLMPPPPPPPPPLPPPSMLLAKEPTIKLMIREKSDAEPTSVTKVDSMLDISSKKVYSVPQQFAIDEIINQIKGGHFTLKRISKQREERKKQQEAENTPPAVSEMLNILGDMRRKAKPKRQF